MYIHSKVLWTSSGTNGSVFAISSDTALTSPRRKRCAEVRCLTALDTREAYAEDRWIGVGMSRGRVLVVAFTDRDDGRVIRIISLRKALSHERKAFEEILGN